MVCEQGRCGGTYTLAEGAQQFTGTIKYIKLYVKFDGCAAQDFVINFHGYTVCGLQEEHDMNLNLAALKHLSQNSK